MKTKNGPSVSQMSTGVETEPAPTKDETWPSNSASPSPAVARGAKPTWSSGELPSRYVAAGFEVNLEPRSPTVGRRGRPGIRVEHVADPTPDQQVLGQRVVDAQEEADVSGLDAPFDCPAEPCCCTYWRSRLLPVVLERAGRSAPFDGSTQYRLAELRG